MSEHKIAFDKVDINSHSSYLTNDRIDVLLNVAHTAGIRFDRSPNILDLQEYFSSLKHIWLYVRQIVANPEVREYLDKLFDDTKQNLWITYSAFNSGKKISVLYLFKIEAVIDTIFDMMNKVLQKGSRYYFRTQMKPFADKMIVDYLQSIGVNIQNADEDEELTINMITDKVDEAELGEPLQNEVKGDYVQQQQLANAKLQIERKKKDENDEGKE